jgi:hypothetical protein
VSHLRRLMKIRGADRRWNATLSTVSQSVVGKLLTMSTFCRNSAIACVVLASLAAPAVAKRVNPKPVAAVISDRTRYTAQGDGRDQYIVAADDSSGSELWRVKVFHSHIEPWVEEDVQWVFITHLKLAGNALLVRDEKSRCYSVDLTKKRVKKLQCGGAFSQ